MNRLPGSSFRFACALAWQEDYFAPAYARPKCNLRLAHYPPQQGRAVAQGQLRYGAHTDYTVRQQGQGSPLVCVLGRAGAALSADRAPRTCARARNACFNS